jgi:hypothetical protein
MADRQEPGARGPPPNPPPLPQAGAQNLAPGAGAGNANAGPAIFNIDAGLAVGSAPKHSNDIWKVPDNIGEA